MSARVHRRHFITLLGGAATWPHAARAQQPAMPVIGFLGSGWPDRSADVLSPLRQGLSETGYVEGRSVAIEYRWAEDQYDRLPALAADLVRRPVVVIAAVGASAAAAAKAATTTIPIIFNMGVDPVDRGFVASLNRPGGNLTGVSNLNVGLEQKRLELMHEVIPTAMIIALLVNPTNPLAETNTSDVQAAARILGRQLHVLHASTERDFDTVFATLAQQRAGPLVISADSFFNSRSKLLGELTLRHAVPAIYEDRAFAAAGGLMTYGGRTPDMYRIAGAYTGRILKGERPADLPVQQGTRVELIINVKTAKVLGLSIPLPLLARADEVIE